MNSWNALSASCFPGLWKHFSCKKVVKMLEELVVSWREVRWVWLVRQNFIAQFVQLLKCLFWDMWSGIAWRRNGPFLSTNATCRYCSFWCISSISWVCFSEVAVSQGLGKRRIGLAADRQPVTAGQVCCRELLGASAQSRRWVGHSRLYKIHLSS